MIPQMEPNYGKEEIEAITQYLKQEPKPWLTEHKETKKLEKMIADYTGSKYCTMVSNGTVSLTAALIAIGTKKVIVPDYTMLASASAATLAGCEVILADIEKQTLCIDYDDFVEKHRTHGADTLMLVSVNGRYPIQLPEILDYCNRNHIMVVEDAAQSLGSFERGKHVGTLGEIGSFSLSVPKIITTGQGGCLVTNSKELHERIQQIKDFGRVTPGSDDYATLGWNFKFTDLQAVIGIEQMKKLPHRVIQKRNFYKHYRKCLDDNRVDFILTNMNHTTPWMNDILVSPSDRAKLLKMQNVGCRPFYPAIHLHPFYKKGCCYRVASWASERGLWLPSSTKLTFNDIEFVCKNIKRTLGA